MGLWTPPAPDRCLHLMGQTLLCSASLPSAEWDLVSYPHLQDSSGSWNCKPQTWPSLSGHVMAFTSTILSWATQDDARPHFLGISQCSNQKTLPWTLVLSLWNLTLDRSWWYLFPDVSIEGASGGAPVAGEDICPYYFGLHSSKKPHISQTHLSNRQLLCKPWSYSSVVLVLAGYGHRVWYR